MAKRDSETDDLLREAREAFERCADAERDNRRTALEDIRFARDGIQWPEKIAKQRELEGRPCLTINKLPAFIRQVVNDARQNKPGIKVRPVDSGADPETADIMSGLIRNIEYTSNADVAYDTAVECAVTGGIGYIRIGLGYAYDDSVDLDIEINRVANPFSIYADPNSRAADSSDWDVAFVTDRIPRSQYEREYKDAAKVDWDDDAWSGLVNTDWLTDDSVLVAEWWTREKVDRAVVVLDDGSIHDKASLPENAELMLLLEQGIVRVVAERVAKSCLVKQRIMSGAEILKTEEWPGRYIPIVPVYGDEFDIEGKRYFRSLIHNAIDAQRMFNYWRTASTELVALAPKVPFIGKKGSFDDDIDNWNTANTRSHPFLEYTGEVPPQRQPLDMGVAAGALQEALNASDDMKAIIGMYDASLGARSNETSGRAIMARQREGDISTFHFVDNMARAIRHTGRILIDLIPKVYDKPRMIRVIGEDGSQAAPTINKEAPAVDLKSGQPMVDERGQAIMRTFDLTAGKYDLTVTTGPSFTTRREEAAMQMTEMIRAMPGAVPILGKHLAKNLDWPGADEIAEELEAMSKPPQVPPEMQQEIGKLSQENQSLKADMSVDAYKAQAQTELQRQKFEQDAALARERFEFEAEIARSKLANEREIALARIKADRDSKAMQTEGAVEATGPDGESTVKTGTELVLESIDNLARMVVQQGQATNAAIERLAEYVAAPNELIRDPKTRRAVGSRKVLPTNGARLQ